AVYSATRFKRRDFPAPLGPTTTTIAPSPRAMRRGLRPTRRVSSAPSSSRVMRIPLPERPISLATDGARVVPDIALILAPAVGTRCAYRNGQLGILRDRLFCLQ